MLKNLIIILIVIIDVSKCQVDTLWSHAYGGSDNDWAADVVKAADGSFVMTGISSSGDETGEDFIILKTNSDGIYEWSYYFDNGGHEGAVNIDNTHDGGFILSGADFSNWDVMIIKSDSLGNSEWIETFGDSINRNIIFDSTPTTDSNFVFVGYSINNESNNNNVLCMKIDQNGNELWNFSYDYNGDEGGHSIIQTSDGGFVILGYYYIQADSSEGGNVLLIKINQNGIEEWSQIITVNENLEEYGDEVLQTNDGGFILLAHVFNRTWLVKTDSNGVVDWHQYYNFSAPIELEETDDNSYIIFGGELDNTWILKINSIGNVDWSQTFTGSGFGRPNSVLKSNDDKFIVAGVTNTFGNGENDFWIAKFGEFVGVKDENPIPENFKLFPAYPNPFNPITTIRFSLMSNQRTTLKIFDITGRLVETLVNGKLVSGEQEIIWNAENKPSGVYFVRLQSGEFIETQKIILMK